VDTFFWMGGLLTAGPLLRQLRRKGWRWFGIFPVYAVGRWLRLTPLVAMAILFTMGVIPWLGDGPFWALLASPSSESAACRSGGWWVDLVYGQNIAMLLDDQSGLGRCEGHFWYLANDMQFFLCAPFLLLPLARSPRLGWLLWGLVLAGSTASNVIISWNNHYSASPLFDQGYFTYVYVQPWCRAQPYLIGLAFGALWDKRQRLATPPSRLRPLLVWVLALSTAVLMLTLTFGTWGLYQNMPTPWNALQNICYISLSRLGWAVGLSVIAYLCFCDELPLVNALLSFWPFQVYGKITFAAYVVHPLIMTAMNYGSIDYIAYTDAWYAQTFTCFLVWASAVGLVLWLFIEKPVANLIALLLGKLGLKA